MVHPTSEYNRKRNFTITSEPPEELTRAKRTAHALRFVIQKHDARRLHYDFRLELNGTLKSWAVPKGPSLDPKDKRLAVHVEDHPISYAKFEGSIPQGQYGGGDVIVWDQGVWEPLGDAEAGYKAGKLKFRLIGEKLTGNWTLVKMHFRGNSDKEQWLLMKEDDEVARPSKEYDIVQDRPESVITGKLLPIDNVSSTLTATKANHVSPATKGRSTISSHSKTLTQKSELKTKAAQSAIKKLPTSKKPDSVSIPHTFSPELATLVSEPPDGEWLYEIKFDGYRILARVLNGKVNLFTRNGNDWTERLPQHARTIENLHLQDSWLDGEVVVLNKDGIPSFQALQNAFDSGNPKDIIFYLFDAPFLNGFDLRDVPVEKRRAALKKVIPHQKKSLLRFSAAFDTDHSTIIESACSMSLEGVIGKRAGSTYISRRSTDWIKLKCRLRQEFVIIGYTEPQGSRSRFGAILLGVHKAPNSSQLIYAGRVGTGFNRQRLDDIYQKMHALEDDNPAVSVKLTGAQARGVHWVKPKLVCEVEFAEWTNEGILRQAAFVSLRTDKPAKEIIRERALRLQETANNRKSAKEAKKKPASSSLAAKHNRTSIAGIGISHPDRVIDIESGRTKLDLAAFYEKVSDFILPHLAKRPVSLLRVPNGISSQQFFQKHSDNNAIPHLTHLDPSLDPNHDSLMEIADIEGLISCVQMNTIELHTWGATSTNIETPDRFILDLDPDPVLPWRSVIEATQLTLAVLDELKLAAYVKTTGGKGMHILVPLTPDADWDSVKAFSKAISHFMATQIPERFVAKMGPKNRIGKIFIDYLRNARGASTVCAYSVRARPGLPVSVPLSRTELDKISHPNDWNIGNLSKRLDKLKTHPWVNYDGKTYTKSQKISKAMWKKLGASPLS